MTERVTEGLGSAMLSIWLRDVQYSSTVLRGHGIILPHAERLYLAIVPLCDTEQTNTMVLF